MRYFFLTSSLSGCMFLLSACALFPGKAITIETYDLSIPKIPKNKKRVNKQIIVSEPVALKALDGENIVVRFHDSSIRYFSRAQWADRLPRILQARLTEALQKSFIFLGVGRPGEGLSADYEIITEIRRFYLEVEHPKRASVELFLKIIRDKEGVVVSSRTFEANVPVSGEKKRAYIKAIDNALEKIFPDIIDWIASVAS